MVEKCVLEPWLLKIFSLKLAFKITVIAFFCYCRKYAFVLYVWYTIFGLNNGTSYLLTILVLKLEMIVHSTTCWCILNISVCMANRIDPDQMLHSVASDLGLHCLQRLICPNTLGYYGMYSRTSVTQTLIMKTSLFKYTENYIPKYEKFTVEKFWYSSYFCSKHGLWVCIRSASDRQF